MHLQKAGGLGDGESVRAGERVQEAAAPEVEVASDDDRARVEAVF
jgi:hypothetical protein